MVLALKALGNAGHPGSIKTIMRFLPGVAATPVDLPPRVVSAAVQAMRLIAARDPHSVRRRASSVCFGRFFNMQRLNGGCHVPSTHTAFTQS